LTFTIIKDCMYL